MGGCCPCLLNQQQANAQGPPRFNGHNANYGPSRNPLNTTSPSTDRKPFREQPSHQRFIPKTQSQRLREQGNEQFKLKKYDEAISLYRKAIQQPSPQIACYNNLALAYKTIHQDQRAIDTIDLMIDNPAYARLHEDAFFRKGLSIKARCQVVQAKIYCLAGEYTQQENQKVQRKLQQAIVAFIKLQNPPNPVPQIQTFRKSAEQVKLFLNQSIIPSCKSDKLLHFMRDRLPQKQKSENSVLFQRYFKSGPEEVLSKISDMIQEEKKTVLTEEHEWVIDPITYQVYKDPAIVPSGISYELSGLRQHFKNNGYKDPITHQLYQLGEKVVINNHTLQTYLRESGTTLTKQDLEALQY